MPLLVTVLPWITHYCAPHSNIPCPVLLSITLPVTVELPLTKPFCAGNATVIPSAHWLTVFADTAFWEAAPMIIPASLQSRAILLAMTERVHPVALTALLRAPRRILLVTIQPSPEGGWRLIQSPQPHIRTTGGSPGFFAGTSLIRAAKFSLFPVSVM